MTSAAWLSRAVRAWGQLLLRSYPSELRAAIGPELLDVLDARIRVRLRERGLVSALLLALRELAELALAGFEARRELARAMRLGAPGAVGAAPGLLLETATAELADAARGIRRSPVHARMVVFLIATGVGLSAAVFSVVDGVLLEAPPFPDPDRLVHVWTERAWQDEPRGLVADVQVKALRDSVPELERVSALWMVSGRILGGEQPVHTDVGRVSADFFDLLGVEPHVGRTFQAGEDQPGAPWVAVLDYDYWIEEFSGDPEIIGEKLVVGWPEMEIIGVLPPDFRFRIPPELGAHGDPDVWIPWWHNYRPDGRANGGVLAAVGRLAPGATDLSVRESLERLSRSEDAAHYQSRGFRFTLEPLQTAWTADARPSLMVLAGAATLVLLLAAVNAGTLLLARTQRRGREIGLRRALGAAPGRVARLLVAESVLLALMGGFMGVIVAFAATDAMVGLAPGGLRGLEGIHVNGKVLVFALAASVLAGLAAVVAPALHVARTEPATVLSAGGRTLTETRRSRKTRGVLVVTQVALSVILLVGAGLLMRSFLSLRSVDLGLEPEGRLTFSVYLMDEYRDLASRVAFHDRLRQGLLGLPQVRSVSGISILPLTGAAPRVPVSTFARSRDVDPASFFLTEGFSVLLADDLEGTNGDGWTLSDVVAVQPEYPKTAGSRMIAGRALGREDGAAAPLRAVVDATLAERLWGAAPEAVGKRMWLAGAWRRVVGVTEPSVRETLRGSLQPVVYLPYAQVQSGRVSVMVHGKGTAAQLEASVRAQIARLDPRVPIADVRSMSEIVRDATAADRFLAGIMGVFAMTALVLVTLGVYAVLSFTVGERTREIAVRLAAGSGRAHVAGLVVRHGLALTGLGLAVGVVGAVALGRLVRDLLYQTPPADLLTLAITCAVVVLVALLACTVPALRAVSVDPAEILRCE